MRNSNLSSESDCHARKARKSVENDRKGSGKSEKNTRKWNFFEKPPMKDFKNCGFYIPKIHKTDPWKNFGSNSDVNNKYIQAGCEGIVFGNRSIRKNFCFSRTNLDWSTYFQILWHFLTFGLFFGSKDLQLFLVSA